MTREAERKAKAAVHRTPNAAQALARQSSELRRTQDRAVVWLLDQNGN